MKNSKPPSRSSDKIGPRLSSVKDMSRLSAALLMAIGLCESYAAPVALSNSIQGFTGSSTTQLDTSTSLEIAGTGTDEQINFDSTGAKFGVNKDGDPGVLHPGPDGIPDSGDETQTMLEANAAGYPGRNSIRTIDKTYATVNFDAYVTLNEPGTNLEAWLGMGSAAISGWSEPSAASDNAVYGSIRVGAEFWGGTNNFIRSTKVGPNAKAEAASHGGVPDLTDVANKPVRLKMSHNAASKTVTFSFDYAYNGTFVADASLAPVSTKGQFNGSGSAIFFGARSNAVMSDFVIDNVQDPGPIPVPNPAQEFEATLTAWTGTSQSNFPAQAQFLTDAGLEAAFVWDGGESAWEAVGFSPTGSKFGINNGSIGARNTIRTIEQNYESCSFVASITVANLGNESIFGIGTANFVGSGAPSAPGSNAVYLHMLSTITTADDPATTEVNEEVRENTYSGVKVGPTSTSAATPVALVGNSPFRIQMVHTTKSKTILLSFDTNYDGVTFTPDVTLAPISTADILTGTRASIFFSGQAGAEFTDLTIDRFEDLPFDHDTSLKAWTGNSQTARPGQVDYLTAAGLEAAWVWPWGEGAWERVDFNSSGAIFGTVNNSGAGRNSLRTIETEYDGVSFNAFVTVAALGTDLEAWLGLGKGDKVSWGGPGADSVFLNFRHGSALADQKATSVKVVSSGTTNNDQSFAEGFVPTAPIRMKLSYDAVAKTATLSVDNAYDGTFVADYTLPVVDTSDMFAGTNRASVFFGGRAGATLTDFQLTKFTPTPVSTNDYVAWAASNGITGTMTDDQDGDGVTNLIEYALADGSENGSFNAATRTVSFTKRAAPYGADVTVVIEESDDLGVADAWEAVAHSTDGDTISYTLPTGRPKVFARLKVTKNP
jgi:hypothetical protein